MAYPFVVLEGIDGCGKDTQARLLLTLLKRRRLPAFLHKYPTDKAKGVQAHLQSKSSLSPDALFDAFVADLQSEQAALSAQRLRGWVVADRYCLSTAAYQGTGGKLDARLKQLLSKPWVKPDVVLWLDLPVSEAMARKAGQKTPDRHESDAAFLEQVRENYEQLYRTQFLSSNWKRINASPAPEKVAEQIRKLLEF
ncbi:MAG: dTMP kinase [Candidatus Micrarchaeota archaeon]|nr:dTMP kinase [Candidatus Micrarchaeota archaeon]